MNQQIQDILKEAVNAPSGDNSQPWRFEASRDTISIFNLPDRDIPFYNFGQRGSYIAHGALAENIAIAASTRGLTAAMSLFPNPDNELETVRIRLTSSDIPVDSLAAALPLRETNRKPYRPEALPQDAIREMTQEARRIGGGNLVWCTERDALRRAAAASSANERTVLETKPLHEIFFHHVVWTAEEEKEKRTGLFVKTLEMMPPQEAVFKLYRSWRVANFFNRLGFSRFIASENAKLYAASGALAAVVIDRNTPADFLTAGRTTERLWLAANQRGFGVHPVTGILFLMQRIAAGEPGGLSDRHIRLIKEQYQVIEDIFGAKNKTIAMILRIGRTAPASARSSKFEPAIAWKD